MIRIHVTLPDGSSFLTQCQSGTTPEDIVRTLKRKPAHQILACLIDNRNERLDTPLEEDGEVKLLDMTSSYGNMSYQMSLTLLYLKAVHDVLGNNAQVTIANSLSKGLFTRIRSSSVNDETAAKIQKRMEELVSAKLPVTEEYHHRDHMIRILKKEGPVDDLKLFESAYDLQGAYICQLDDEKALFYQHLLPDTSYLKRFEIRRYRNGMLLRFPQPYDPEHVPVFEEQKLLYEAFSEESHWDHLLGISSVTDLNEKVRSGNYLEMIELSEALHEKKIAEIAEMIHDQKKRIVLIAGPSSSGKTTFAKRLCTQMRVTGLRPLYLGTDDYFIDRDQMPVGPDGKRDFEALSAVDTKLFAQQMNALLDGQKVDLPEFDFLSGKKIYGKRITSIDSSQPIVIEGIHGLNPKLTEGIPDEEKFRIYISPLTQLNIDGHHRVPTTDARMLRRLVRDYRTRGRSAAMTIDDWPNVRRGEEKNIFPFSNQADVFFNSQCQYELAVLKKYAEPLLKSIGNEEPEYPEAQRMLQFLSFFVSIQDDSVIANNSIIREFIGGSIVVN